MTRVLYVVDTFPTISESYVRAEVEFAASHGIEVAIAADTKSRVGVGFPVQPGIEVAYGADSVARLRSSWRPDVVHVHWANIAWRAAGLGLPTTIRGHSFEFDRDLITRLCGNVNVRRFWVFPSQIGLVNASPKISALPCAFDAARYRYAGEPKRPLVLRVAAGLPGKDLEGFLEIARLCRDAKLPVEFILAVTTPVMPYADSLDKRNAGMGSPARIIRNMGHDECAALMREARVYLRSHDPAAHPYGMPISISEAMASGCFIVARDDPGARQYIGPAGAFYKTEAEAAALIESTLKKFHPPLAEASMERARLYTADAVLPAMLAEWRAVAP